MLSLFFRSSCSAWHQDVHTVSGPNLLLIEQGSYTSRSHLGQNTSEEAKSSEGAMEM